MWTIIISLILVSYFEIFHTKRTTMEISRIYLLFVQSLAIYVLMFNLESLYCILLNKIKSKRTRYIEIICDRKVLRNCLDLLTY